MKGLATGLAALVLTGCSLVGLGYNRLPTLVYWRLDNMVDLTDAQSAVLRPAIDGLHTWHRRVQLPVYEKTLRLWADRVAQDTTADEVCRQFDSLRPGLDQLVQQALPSLARLAAGLTPEQRQHLQRHHQKTDAAFLEDFGADKPGVVGRKRLERAVDRAEMLYGNLTPAQEALLEQGLARSAFDANRTLQERQRRQADMLAAIEQIQAGAPALPTVQAVWARYTASPTPGYNAYSQTTQRQACELFAALHNSTGTAQRAAAAKTLLAYAGDVAKLGAP
ncbi:MAG: hypothetical protein RJA09_377 [Pseudomonadota bacterium]